MFPLVISVDRDHGDQATKPAFMPPGESCRFCGLEDQHMILTLAEGNPGDQRPACYLCASVLKLGLSTGYLAYLPTTSQADLNHVVRTAVYAMNTGPVDLRARAMGLLRYLHTLTKPVKAIWGSAAACDFAQLLGSLGRENYLERKKILGELRFFPHPGKLPRAVTTAWAQSMTAEQKRLDGGHFAFIFDSFHTPNEDQEN